MNKEQLLQQDAKPVRSSLATPTKRHQPGQKVESVTTAGSTQAVPRSLRRLTCVSVTDRTHSIDLVGELAPDDSLALARTIQNADRVTETMVLSTCNRIEVYLSTRTPASDDRDAALAAATDVLGLPSDAQAYAGRDVVRHLARVAAGIESAVLGEHEIAGQVGDAVAAATEDGLIAGVLNRVGNTALRAGRKSRAETAIDEGPAGYRSAVCRVIAEELGDPPARVLIVGAGAMASAVSQSIRSRWNSRIDVANRSPAWGPTTPDGAWWTLDELQMAIDEVDVIVTATSADRRIFEPRHADRCEETVPVVDLATPPDVAARVQDHPAVEVTDLSELAATVRSVTDHRREAVTEAESVIEAAVDRLIERERESQAEDVIRQLHKAAADIRATELERAKDRLADGEASPEEILEDFASALAGQLLGPPTDELRTAARERDETALRAARRLFNLDGGDGS